MNKYVKEAIKIALVGGALASALTGCCMCDSGRYRCGTCCKPPCECRCKSGEDCARKCDNAQKRGANASVTLGVGTDGLKAETSVK